LPKAVETALPPAVNSPLLHCINQGDRSIDTSKKSTSPAAGAIKRCTILFSLGISAACYTGRVCALATCICRVVLRSPREHTLVARKRWRVRWLQISHWLTARLAAGARARHLHEIIAWRLHGVKQLPLFAREMTSPCVGLVCHGIDFGRDPGGVSNLTNLSSADFCETLMLIS
jgi:hypothetical protein